MQGNQSAFFEIQSSAGHSLSAVETFSIGEEHFLIVAQKSNVSEHHFNVSDVGMNCSNGGFINGIDNQSWGVYR